MISAFVFGALLVTSARAANGCDRKAPVYKYEVCSINNFTITSTAAPGKTINCDASVHYTLLTSPPNVSLVKFDSNRNQLSDLVLIAFDATVKQLLWALSNVTPGEGNIVSQSGPKTLTHKPYQTITGDPQKKKHTLVLALYQRQPRSKTNAQITVNQSSAASFDLTKWTSEQIQFGVELCGPLATANIIVDTTPQWAADKQNETGEPTVTRNKLGKVNQNDSIPKASLANSSPPSKQRKVSKRHTKTEESTMANSKMAKVNLTRNSPVAGHPLFSSLYAKNNSPRKPVSTNSLEPASADEKPKAWPAQSAQATVHYAKQSPSADGRIAFSKVARAAMPTAEVNETGPGANTTVQGETTGNVTGVAGKATGASGNETGASGNETGAVGNETGAAGNETGAAGNVTGAAGKVIGAAGNETGAAGNETGAAGNITGTIGKVIQAAGNTTGAAGNTTGDQQTIVQGANETGPIVKTNGGGEVIGNKTGAAGNETGAAGNVTGAVGKVIKAAGNTTGAAGNTTGDQQTVVVGGNETGTGAKTAGQEEIIGNVTGAVGNTTGATIVLVGNMTELGETIGEVTGAAGNTTGDQQTIVPGVNETGQVVKTTGQGEVTGNVTGATIVLGGKIAGLGETIGNLTGAAGNKTRNLGKVARKSYTSNDSEQKKKNFAAHFQPSSTILIILVTLSTRGMSLAHK